MSTDHESGTRQDTPAGGTTTPADQPDPQYPTRSGEQTATEPEDDFDGFNFWRDVIGDDLVFGGVVYDSREWTWDYEDGVRRITGADRAAGRHRP
jgi:hypothetical protein